MSKPDLKAIKKLLAEITPGNWHPWTGSFDHPWRVFSHSLGGKEGPRVLIAETSRWSSSFHEADVKFVAAAPVIIRELVAHVEKLESDVRKFIGEETHGEPYPPEPDSR